MNCKWIDDGDREPDGTGTLRCSRIGCDGVILKTKNKGHEVKGERTCKGIPHAYEFSGWVGVFADAFGIPMFSKPPPAKSTPLKNAGLTDAELTELFPNEDPSLLGNRIKAVTDAIGFPPCGGCDRRRQWINVAHEQVRKLWPKKLPPTAPAAKC